MKIVFFDGNCVLCNSLVDWLIKKDPLSDIKFASLESDTAQKTLPKNYLARKNTIIYLRDEKLLDQSSAILILFSDLKQMGIFIKILFFVPKFIRDFGYKLIAKNRYKFFGNQMACRIPSDEEKHRFLS